MNSALDGALFMIKQLMPQLLSVIGVIGIIMVGILIAVILVKRKK